MFEKAWLGSGCPIKPTADSQKNATYKHTSLYQHLVLRDGIEGATDFHHSTKGFRRLEVVMRLFQESASDVTAEPHLPLGAGLKRFIDTVDAIACILNFEMPSLKKRDTCSREAALKKLNGCGDTEKNRERNSIKP